MRARELQPADRFEVLSQVHARLQLDAARATAPDERSHCLRLASVVFDCLREEGERRQAAARIVYRHLGDDVWELGREGNTQPVAADSPIGAHAAHQVLRGMRPRCCDFSQAKDADRVLRRAVREHAADWAERHGCRELAGVMRAIEVRGGRLQYAARPGAPVLVLS